MSDRLRAQGGVLAGALAAICLSTLVAALVLHAGEGSLSLPWNYASEGDAKFYLLLVKSILAHGGYETNSSLGAPFGLQLYDFPQGGDNLNLLLIRGLGAFSQNPAWVLNVFFMLTFPLTAGSAYAALRWLRVSAGAALVCAVIFALLPYHFYRGESQVLLSAYYGVPLGALLFLRLWDERGLFARRKATDGRPAGLARRASAWVSGTSALTVVCCLIVGSTGLYYAVFALLLLLAGSLLALLAGRGWGVALSGVLAATLVAATLAVNLAPSLSYRSPHGANVTIKRTTIEADQFGLRLTDLLLPVQQHRFGPLSHINQHYTEATATGYCEACFENLGAVGSAGFLWLAVVALASIAGVAGTASVLKRRANRLVSSAYRPAALGVALCFVLATIGGIASLIAFFVTRDIRGWNRISLFIAFFSLYAVALLLDAGRRRLAGTGAGRLGAAAMLAGVLVFGVLDETSGFFVPKYAKNAAQWRSDGRFVAEIEARMPPGASIFQLPYVPFPEGYGATGTSVSPPNPNFGTTYELARGYIHSGDLRWSYAAMKGRPADWQAELASKSLYLSLAAAAADGFQGLWVDPHGYSADVRPRLAPVLEKLLGVAPLRSPAGDLLFFDLRPFAAALVRAHGAAQTRELRSKTLNPIRIACGSGGLEVTDPSPTPRVATLQMRISMPGPKPMTVLIHYPGGESETRTLTTKPVKISRRMTVLPGATTIGFSLLGAPAPGARRIGGPRIDQPTLTEQALVPFEPPPRGLPGGLIQAGFAPPPCLQTVEAVRSGA
jgi:phosphoglycerol transferase